MTIEKALEMIKAHNKCVKTEREKHCSSKCDGCSIGYAQGHVGEVNEMYEQLVEWIEELKECRGIDERLPDYLECEYKQFWRN